MRLICLANSRKLGGRCIAGKLMSTKGDVGLRVLPSRLRATAPIAEATELTVFPRSPVSCAATW